MADKTGADAPPDSQLANIVGAQVNPATEDTLDAFKLAFDARDLSKYTEQVTQTGKLQEIIAAISPVLSAGNSSDIALAANAEFIGTAQYALPYAEVSIFAHPSHDSAVDGLKIEWSEDGATGWHASDTFTISASGTKQFTFGVIAPYMRVRFLNGAVAQTHFHLLTILRPNRGKPSSHRISESITNENDAELVMSVVTGYDPLSFLFRNVQTTPDGRMKVDAQSSSASATLNDKYFSVDSGLVNIITGSAEVPFLLVTNPTGSGKSLKLNRVLYLSIDNVNVIFRRYAMPTGVTGGSALTVRNLYIGSSTPSAMTATLQPAATGFGNRLHGTFTIGAVEATDLAGSLVLQPNTSILLTVETASNNKRVSANLEWIEET